MALRVGGTPLFKSIELSGRCGATVFVKNESKNPFGTFKDRRCAALLGVHRSREETIFVHITSGNSGYSLGMLAQEEMRQNGGQILVVNIVPKNLADLIKSKLATCSIVYEADLSEKPLTREDLLSIAKKAIGYSGSEQNIITVEEFGLANGYRKIIDEIQEQGVKPTYIFCPVGEGELATELTTRALEVWATEPPKILGVTISQNAIVQKADFLPKPGKNVADKLVNGYSKFKAFVKRFVETKNMGLTIVNESQIAKEYFWLNATGIACEPSATAAFCGALNHQFKPDDVVVIINTGKGIYDEKSIDKLWLRRIQRFAKTARVALASAAVVVSLVAGAIYERNQTYETWRSSMEDKVRFYFDDNKDSFEQEEEIAFACKHIPDKKCEVGIHPTVHYFSDFSDAELVYIYRHMFSIYSMGSIGRIDNNDKYNIWLNGRYDYTKDIMLPWILRADVAVRRFLTPTSNCDNTTAKIKNGWAPEECVPSSCDPEKAINAGLAGYICKAIPNPARGK